MNDRSINQVFEKIGKIITNKTYLGKGEASIVYKVETNTEVFVLKTALYPERKMKVVKEARIRSFFINHGLTFIPKPIYVDEEIFPNEAVIYEFIEGNKPVFDNKMTIQQMARIMSSIHQINYQVIENRESNVQTLFNSLKETITTVEEKYSNLVNDVIQSAFTNAIQEFSEMVEKKNFKNQLGIKAQLHGDVSDNFIIDHQNKIWLIDWENSEFGDIVEELSWFLSINNIHKEFRSLFYHEYQKNFIITKDMQLEGLYQVYSATTPVFNICWGIDQLDTNLKYHLETKRKITDLLSTAVEWGAFYSKATSKLIQEGIELLANKVI